MLEKRNNASDFVGDTNREIKLANTAQSNIYRIINFYFEELDSAIKKYKPNSFLDPISDLIKMAENSKEIDEDIIYQCKRDIEKQCDEIIFFRKEVDKYARRLASKKEN